MATYAVECFLDRSGDRGCDAADGARAAGYRLRRANRAVALCGAVLLPESEICLLLIEAPSRAEAAAAVRDAGMVADGEPEAARFLPGDPAPVPGTSPTTSTDGASGVAGRQTEGDRVQ